MKRLSFLFTVAILAIFSQAVKAQEHYFRFIEKDKKVVNTIVTQTISIDNLAGDTVYAYANPIELEKFKSLGYDLELLPHPSSHTKDRAMATTIEEMANWDKYPTYEVYREMMKKFEADYPELCKLDSIGTSVQGRKLYVVKISSNVLEDDGKTEFFYTSTMHGDETTGYVLMLRLIDYLLSNYGTDNRVTDMVDNLAVYINPNANPDGTYWGGNHTVNNARRANANGIDLNRNFPYIPSGGPTPQPETTIMMDFAESRNFVMSSNIHGGIELMNFPWDTWTSSEKKHADHNWFYTVSREYATLAQENSPSGYFTGMNNGVTHGGDWYAIDGGRQDFMNYFHHCREITLEISDTKNPASSELPDFWDYNKEALLTYIENVYYGIQGTITNTQGEPINATITIAGHDKDNSHVITNPINGKYIRMIEPGTYDVTYSSEGYIDQIHNITVSDYSSLVIKNVELISGNQTNLSGTVSDAETDAHIEGAKIEFVGSSIEPSYTNSQGEYSFVDIPENTYQIRVEKEGYYSQIESHLLTGESNIINFSLSPTFAESFEDGIPEGFTFTGDDWTLDNATAYHQEYSLKSATISHNQQTAVTITLDVYEDGEILFARKVSSESGYDYLKFFIGDEEQGKWSGEQNWEVVSYPVSTGTRTFEWVYEKDGSVSEGSDCAWIDYIYFPPSHQTITFNVTTTGNPVNNATVNFNNQTINTNSFGDAVFTNVPKGLNKEFTVSKVNYHDANGTINVLYTDFTNDVELESSISRYTATFIVSGYGEPIEEATVTLSDLPKETNSDGEAVFTDLLEGTYSYSIEAEGYYTKSGSIFVDQDETFPISLVPLPSYYSILFKVQEEDETPIASATVQLGNSTLVTNTDGEAFFESIVEGEYGYLVNAQNFIPIEESLILDENKEINVILLPATELYTITFIAKDYYNVIIEGATVSFFGEEVETNSLGEAIFSDVDAGIHNYMVEAEGYHNTTGKVVANDNKTVNVALEEIPPSYTVAFSVKNADGAPVEGSTITMNGTEETTDNDGFASFANIYEGDYTFSVEAEGYYTFDGEVYVDEDKEIDIELISLPSLYTVVFIVTDSVTSNPIENATITLNGSIKPTDSNGEAIFIDVEENIYSFIVTADDYYPDDGSINVNDDLQIEISLAPKPTLYQVTFTVYDSESNNPLEGASVTFNNTTEVTDDQGITTFYDLEENDYSYSVIADNYFSIEGSLLVDEDKEIDIYLDPIPPVYYAQFKVEDEDELPIQDVSVTLNSITQYTNQEGTTTFEDLLEDTYNYRVSKVGYDTIDGSLTIYKDTIINITLTEWVDPTYTATFQVSDGINPVPNALISINGTSLTTNDNGQATINLIDGTYYYSVSAEGFEELTEQTLTIDGDDVQVNVILEPIIMRHIVTFKIFDVDNNGIEGAIVTLNEDEQSTDTNGKAVFIDVPEGSYDYQVIAQDFYDEEGNLQLISDTTINVNLNPVGIPANQKPFLGFDLWPNPFSQQLNIGFILSSQSDITIDLIALTGQKVSTIVNSTFEAGEHQISWDNTTKLAEGVYIIRVTTNSGTITKRIIFSANNR